MNLTLDAPADIRHAIWQHITRACHDRHHPWSNPVLATTTPDREPNARTVILRAANATQQTLTAFTDHRSAKATELAEQPKALFVFWSPRLKWQLRVRPGHGANQRPRGRRHLAERAAVGVGG